MQPKGIIFDLDGTLIDSLEDIANSMNTLLAGENLPIHTTEAYRDFVGHGIGKLVQRALPENMQDEESATQFLGAYMTEYEKQCLNKTHPYEGIRDLLGALQSMNLDLAVFSNKAHPFTEKMVKAIFPDNPFSHVLGAKENMARKPNPAGALMIAENMNLKGEEIIFIGDSEVDIETGKNASMTTIGVTWGFRERKVLENADPDFMADTPEEIKAIVESLNEKE